MADIEVIAVQGAEFGYAEPPLGSLVSGVANDAAVLAFAALDAEGRYYLVFDGKAGTITVLSYNQITHMQVIDAVLIVEPTEKSTPFALPFAAHRAPHALVVTTEGEVGLQVGLDVGGKVYHVQTDLRTGGPMGANRRRLLSGFRLSLKVAGRDKPILIGDF